MVKRGFVLEVLSLYIPSVVETEDLVKIAWILRAVDRAIPFTILAFFLNIRCKILEVLLSKKWLTPMSR